MVRVLITMKTVTVNDLAKGEHVDDEKKWTVYRSLRDTAE